ncbi:HD domain-containing protein [Apilactobacillus timberlakei]|uniref:HD domain-containing protein n=1 Tax=Apilactobacillus timberlakei TaxID=2008380 RepID=A0ABY2YVQ7_9LACO|nr:HD domain-containing protein [Apilactobacillus timberlakei]TPR14871.1 HD domain-containing protein [Apilactobacillus timberlakei]TPR15841.1 HD domain-containing protein [Apilactobacillus timberlakei]TPR16202.1 HD domain-containing protein [Apilactobacillus timberlakei]TPR18942.1 HD domain-containing protein [Apilactobacillus timberlakei]TPR20893.1 HD domain-containing protein [Apilactobacillus timberlakei]
MNEIAEIANFVEGQLADDQTGHDFSHIKRVVKLAEQLSDEIPSSNQMIVLTAAYLHDVIDDKLVKDTNKQKNLVIDKLSELDFSSEYINQIMNIIEHMSYSKNLTNHYQLDINGQIVQDADRLDAIGAIGIARAFYFGGHFGDAMYNLDQLPRTNMDKKEYRKHTTVINHFYEKLFKLPDLMNTKTARKLAAQRKKYMENFVNEFKNEWQ